MLKKNTQKFIKNTLPLALGIFLIWISLKNLTSTDIANVKKSFQSANYWWILASLFVGVLSHLSRAYRWKFTLEPLGYTPRFSNSFMSVMIGYLVNLGIPRAGEVSRAATMAEYEKIPFEKGFGTIVAERVADVLMLLLILCTTLATQYDFIKSILFSKLPKNPLFTIVIITLITIAAWLFFKWIKQSKRPFFIKLKSFVEGLYIGIKSILHMKKKWAFIFHTFFIWTMYLLMLYFGSFALTETKGLATDAILICFITGSISYAATNGGIGSYPLAIQQTLLLYEVSDIVGLSFGWIMWTSQTLMIIVFGGLSFLLLPIYNRNKKKPLSNKN